MLQFAIASAIARFSSVTKREIIYALRQQANELEASLD